MTEAPPPPGSTTDDAAIDLPMWGAERLALALAQRPDVTLALTSAVSCTQATAVHDALVQLGQTRTASVVRMTHHGVCGGLHDWRLEKAFPWDDQLTAARVLAAVICAPGVVDRVAVAWLSPPSELALVLTALGCQVEARRWTAACDAADAAFFATHGYDDQERP